MLSPHIYSCFSINLTGTFISHGTRMESCNLSQRDSSTKVSNSGVYYCNENPIYVFPEKELRSLILNFHNYMSVSDLHIPRISSPHIFLQQNRQTDLGNI
jgi:hypothetical protein